MKSAPTDTDGCFAPDSVSRTEILHYKNAIDRFIRSSLPQPRAYSGRGITICGGGVTYFANAWVLVRVLRKHGCNLPIQLWHLGPEECDQRMARLLKPFDVECVDALKVASEISSDGLEGWPLKAFSTVHSPFDEVLALDADNVPIRNPEYLMDSIPFRQLGSVFWPDSLSITPFSNPIWEVMGVPFRGEQEFETGQFMVRKSACWEPLQLALWMNLHWRFFYKLVWGDKDTFRFAWHKFGRTFGMPPRPPQILGVGEDHARGIICHHDFAGERIFQHRTVYKWQFFGENPQIAGCLLEPLCREFLNDLKSKWNGTIQGIRHRDAAPSSKAHDDLVRSRWVMRYKSKELKQAGKAVAPEQETQQVKRPLPTRNTPNRKVPFERRLIFYKDGLFRETALEPHIVFWRLENTGKEEELALLTSSSKVAGRLRRDQRGAWNGRVKVEARVYELEIIPLHVAYPALGSNNGHSANSPLSVAKRRKDRRLHVVNGSTGLGDHVTSVYACCAAADAGLDVVFSTRYAPWLSRIAHPRLVIRDASSARSDSPPDVDLDTHYGIHTRHAQSTAAWYAGLIEPGLKPRRPLEVDRTVEVRRFDFDRYAVIAPFANWSCRDWPDAHWIRLVDLLKSSGMEVVAIGSPRQQKRLDKLFHRTTAFWTTGRDIPWVLDAVSGASIVISNDSGLAHVAGLLGAPTVSIHAQLPPEFLWACTNVKSVTPATACTFCRWLPTAGYHSACEIACSALATVGPEQVIKHAVEVSGGVLV